MLLIFLTNHTLKNITHKPVLAAQLYVPGTLKFHIFNRPRQSVMQLHFLQFSLCSAHTTMLPNAAALYVSVLQITCDLMHC